jgi:hypothetical protein
VNAVNGDGVAAFRAEVAREIFRRKRLALVTEIEQRPKKTLGRMTIDLDRLLHLPLLVPETNEYKIISVQTDAEERIHWLPMLRPHVVKPLFDLLDNFFATRRIRLRPDFVRAPGILIFDNDTGINRINAPAGYGKFVMALQFDACVLLNERKLLFRLDANFLLVGRHRRRRLDLVGELRRFLRNQVIE